MSKNEKIDDISQILHGQRNKLKKNDIEIHDLNKKCWKDETSLDLLLSDVEKLCNTCGIELPAKRHNIENHKPTKNQIIKATWDSLLDEYKTKDPTKNSFALDDLLDPVTIQKINLNFDAPLARQKWDKLDYIVCFSAALIGIITDAFCSVINNPISSSLKNYGTKVHDSNSYYSNFRQLQTWVKENPITNKFDWIKKITDVEVDHNNLPIDYRGAGYKGPYHRVLSGGHDLLRFMSGIWQIKNGQFHGARPLKSGGMIIDIVDKSSLGRTYTGTPDYMSAVINYFLHIASDAFTSTSLPVPGATILREMTANKDLQVFIARSYTKGYNLRHIISQGITPAVTGLVVMLYYLLRYKIPALYKKWKKQPYLIENVPGLKFTEMLTLSHGLVSAINVGKVVINKNPMLLNIPQLMIFLKAALSFSMKTFKRYDYKSIIDRNQLYLNDGWDQIELIVSKPYDLALSTWPREKYFLS
jgi:hypothetical protein